MNLFLNDKPLFEDDIQAWAYGPVVPNVYHEYKKYNFNYIDNSKIDIDSLKFHVQTRLHAHAIL